MSVIGKKPFIQTLFANLTLAELNKLKKLINGEGTDEVVFRSLIEGSPYKLTSADKTKNVFEIQLELSGNQAQNLMNGYLIYNDDYCILIDYSAMKNQQLTLVEMQQDDAGIWSYQILPSEQLSILELRSELDDAGQEEGAEAVEAVANALDNGDLKIASSNIDSGTAEAGKALTSNGTGGAAWTEVRTYKTFPQSWNVSHTTKDFCDDVAADPDAIVGMAYLGEVFFTDMPGSLGNAELVVEVKSGESGEPASLKIITLTLTSGNVAPYHWEYTYWNGGANVSGWVELGGGGGVQESSIATPYDSTATYVVGDLVMNEGVLYQCSVAVTTPEEFDSNKWTATSVSGMIGNIEQLLEDINSGTGV